MMKQQINKKAGESTRGFRSAKGALISGWLASADANNLQRDEIFCIDIKKALNSLSVQGLSVQNFALYEVLCLFRYANIYYIYNRKRQTLNRM